MYSCFLMTVKLFAYCFLLIAYSNKQPETWLLIAYLNKQTEIWLLIAYSNKQTEFWLLIRIHVDLHAIYLKEFKPGIHVDLFKQSSYQWGLNNSMQINVYFNNNNCKSNSSFQHEEISNNKHILQKQYTNCILLFTRKRTYRH